jgi:hypothetical protein
MVRIGSGEVLSLLNIITSYLSNIHDYLRKVVKIRFSRIKVNTSRLTWYSSLSVFYNIQIIDTVSLKRAARVFPLPIAPLKPGRSSTQNKGEHVEECGMHYDGWGYACVAYLRPAITPCSDEHGKNMRQHLTNFCLRFGTEIRCFEAVWKVNEDLILAVGRNANLNHMTHVHELYILIAALIRSMARKCKVLVKPTRIRRFCFTAVGVSWFGL